MSKIQSFLSACNSLPVLGVIPRSKNRKNVISLSINLYKIFLLERAESMKVVWERKITSIFLCCCKHAKLQRQYNGVVKIISHVDDEITCGEKYGFYI